MTFKPDLSNKALSLRRKSGPVKGKRYNSYSPEKRIEVVTKWMALGNLRLTADLCEVNFETVKSWKTMPWWNDMVAEIKASRSTVRDFDDAATSEALDTISGT